MRTPVVFQSTADRWVRVRRDGLGEDPPFQLDAFGFLVEPGGQEQGWCRPADAAAQGGWVLLGEPGTGKTTAFRELAAADTEDPPAPGEGGTVWVNAGNLESWTAAESMLGGYIDALPLKPTEEHESAAPAPLLLVIDQLDESGFLPHLPTWLRQRLRGRDTRGLRVWVGCRTADYPNELTGVLSGGLGSCVVGDLAPLTRDSAATLVADCGIEPDLFFKWTSTVRAGILASIPLTLRVLLDAHQAAPGEVDTTPVGLYGHGVDVLAAEPDPRRVRTWGASTRQERVAIAMRVAAHLLLSARRSVHVHDAGMLTDVAIPRGQLVGASEVAGSGQFEVTNDRVAETLATALFSRTTSTASFAHSSFAAFLAARYLAERLQDSTPMPRLQLEELFLVAAPDEDTAAIPERLRETAAWLLAHAPAETMWLAQTDPEGLLAHTALITDSRVREVVVAELLVRADRIELAERGWQRARWELDHPGLGAQLAEVLNTVVDLESSAWSDVARARLAVRLAHDSGAPELADLLLKIVENPAWPVVLRRQAVSAAIAVDPSQPTVERLRVVLAGLQPPPDDEPDRTGWDGSRADGPAELAGTLLGELWPAHLTFVDVSRFLRLTETRHYIGVFAFQVHSLPQGVSDADLPSLLERTEQLLRTHGVPVQHPGTGPDYLHDEPSDGPPTPVGELTVERARKLRDLVGTVVDRVLGSSRATELVDRCAATLLWFLGKSHHPKLPAPIDLITASDGIEPVAICDLRRALADAMFRYAHDRDLEHFEYWSYRIIWSWGSPPYGSDRNIPAGYRRGKRRVLLDSSDAIWANQHANHYRATAMPVLAKAYSDLADRLSQPPTVVTDEPNDPVVESDKREQLAAELQACLDKACEGDATAFVHWVQLLPFDLDTLMSTHPSSFRFTDYPGVSLWEPAELTNRVHLAAANFLSTEHDHRADWLGRGTHPYSWAGMIAFTTLYELHDDADGALLDWPDIPDDCWRHWVGAILDHTGQFGLVHEDLDRALLNCAAQHAPTELAEAITTHVRANLNSGLTVRLPDLPVRMIPTLSALATELASALLDSEQELITVDSSVGDPPLDGSSEHIELPQGPIRGIAFDSWRHLLGQPLRIQDNATVDLVTKLVTSRPVQTDSGGHQLALSAATAMLTEDPNTHWPTLRPLFTSDPIFSRALALYCAPKQRHGTVTASLTEGQLNDLYRWLATACPPESDLQVLGVHSVTAEEEVHNWRRGILSMLAEHGTPEAVRILRALADETPSLLIIQSNLHEARRRAQAAAATPLTPDEVSALLTDHHRRIVRTAAQLAQVITETLCDVSRDIPGHGNLLWDRERSIIDFSETTQESTEKEVRAKKGKRVEFWRPKDEGAISAYLAHELGLRLGSGRVVINREVVIKPTDAGDSGERPDVKIDIIARDRRGQALKLTVPVEIKGAWHKDVLTAQLNQLVPYCEHLATSDGIYLVGWFPIEEWDMPNTRDRRKAKARRHEDPHKLLSALNLQAREILSVRGKRTHPVVLTIPRAVPGGEKNVKGVM